MRSIRSRAGASLAEVIVVCLLFLLAMALIATLFSYGVRMTRAGEGRADQSSGRTKVASLLRQAMLSSYQSGNTAFYRDNNPDDLVLSFISTRDADGARDWDDGTQQPVFHGYEVFYREPSDGSLRWCRIGTAKSKIASALGKSDILTKLSPQDLKLADSVKSFQLYSPDDGSIRQEWANPLGVRLTLETTRSTTIVTEIPFKFVSL